MPVIFANPQYPQQTGPSPFQQSASTQLNYGEMLREVCGCNPNVDPMEAGRMINNYYRKTVGFRDWYGLKIKGIIGVPNVLSVGQAKTTTNSPIVQGIGSNWDSTLVGLQFRNTFTSAWQTIIAVDKINQKITLDTNYVGPGSTGGYQIIECYVTFGNNVSKLIWATNQLFGWPMDVDKNIQWLNARDTWRTALGWSTKIVKRAMTPDGSLLCEIWPSPIAAQQFPFEAYIQPPNLEDDSDTVVAWIPTDLIVTRAKADALMHKPKKNPFYDPATALQVAGNYKAEYTERLLEAALKDQGMDQTDVTWSYELEADQGIGTGSFFSQAHDI